MRPLRIYSLTIPLIFLPFLVGCASNQTRFESEMEQEIVNSFLKEKLKANGADMLCSQSAFTQCFGRTNQECVSDLSPHSIPCVNKSEEKIAVIRDEEELGRFLELYLACMSTKSLVRHSSKLEEINSCVAEYEVDEDALTRSLYK